MCLALGGGDGNDEGYILQRRQLITKVPFTLLCSCNLKFEAPAFPFLVTQKCSLASSCGSEYFDGGSAQAEISTI